MHDQERELIEKLLARHGGNRARAAEELGISRRTLLNKIKEAGLDSWPGGAHFRIASPLPGHPPWCR
ncbi:MAG TPA: helix-turn-helix domain-containing protein [Spirochaetia bacterium]|nr:helix-turn-helix domain-containing protein [Spirochaetia bacterium]